MNLEGKEKGIDVWLALEAFEYARSNKIDICILVAGDSDYIPLVRKIRELGKESAIVFWDESLPRKLLNESEYSYNVSRNNVILYK